MQYETQICGLLTGPGLHTSHFNFVEDNIISRSGKESDIIEWALTLNSPRTNSAETYSITLKEDGPHSNWVCTFSVYDRYNNVAWLHTTGKTPISALELNIKYQKIIQQRYNPENNSR